MPNNTAFKNVNQPGEYGRQRANRIEQIRAQIDILVREWQKLEPETEIQVDIRPLPRVSHKARVPGKGKTN